MSLLGWIGNDVDEDKQDQLPSVVLDHNKSERFECRWSTVKISKSSSIMLRGMEGTVMGVWIAHGEGRFTFRDQKILEELKKQNCLPIHYTDDTGRPTEKYPMNPNGSIGEYFFFISVFVFLLFLVTICNTFFIVTIYGRELNNFCFGVEIDGIAGICSSNGRHLAMMPHPERCTQMWQWSYTPADWKNKRSPWQRIFDNAYTWCISTQ